MLLNWIKSEHRAKKAPFDKKQWSLKKGKCPIQKNGTDCGVFVCVNATCVVFKQPLSGPKSYNESDFYKNSRNRIAWSIFNKKLNDNPEEKTQKKPQKKSQKKPQKKSQKKPQKKSQKKRDGKFFAIQAPPSNWTLEKHLARVSIPFKIRYTSSAPFKLFPLEYEFTQETFDSLKDGEWVFSTVLYAYMSLLAQHEQVKDKPIIVFDTNLYSFFARSAPLNKKTLRRPTLSMKARYKNVINYAEHVPTPKMKMSRIVVPINLNNNHYILAVIDMKKHNITTYNSLTFSKSKNDSS